MHIPAVRLRTVSHRTRFTAAACAAALAVSAAAVMTSGDDATAPVVAPPSSVSPASGASDLSRYDSALLHHHQVRVLRPSEQTVLAPAQRRAADRFHHR